MKDTIDNATRDQDVIVLGAASVETKGGAGAVETNGREMGIGISDD